MKRYEAIEEIVNQLVGDELVISANGMISRELFSIKDTQLNFYMLGSMGLASSIGLGLALSLPERKVVILDGDGNLLMDMGSLATIGNQSPENLIHIVLDNESYESTGGQPSASNTMMLDEAARAAKYKKIEKVNDNNVLGKLIKALLKESGPSFVLVKVEEGRKHVPRVLFDPEEVKDRFVGRL